MVGIFFSFWTTNINLKICKNENQVQNYKDASGIQKNFSRILNCQDTMPMPNTTKQTWDTMASTFESNFDNNSFGQRVLEPAPMALSTTHPWSQFNDLSLFSSLKSATVGGNL